ncbi:MAG TPA: hypothetical protein DEB74_18395 [Lachnospiraceae bacterium]|nr:hypothetical protein [Lachnospiraceae bacterium]
MLGMRFMSPTINILWDREYYVKFILDLEYYLKHSPYYEIEANFRNNQFPVAAIGEGKKKILLYCVHNKSFDEWKRQWDKRKCRINKNNIFVKMGFNANEKRSIYKVF